ncbi:MAG TPA: hypothetical protein P5119_00845 [Candidatus Aminicenantes bacterium]|nr:hypothetical protein [Candidatus Aminicenantes bacterium]HRY63871.1 hypothetical protein [Candidatus Aminicenantes bacterium]HRZ70784.1 hypothetical protein [Candidatus Aminicenantes bacterium]
MGPADSHHIARVLIHPKDAETVYVAAMGHLFSPNAERGVFKTTDSGRTWARLVGGLPMGRIGRIGLDIFQKNPDILYAAVENVGIRSPPARGAVSADRASSVL